MPLPFEQTINVHLKKEEAAGFVNNQQEDWRYILADLRLLMRISFKFDDILHEAPQEMVFEQAAHSVVDTVFEGYNGVSSEILVSAVPNQ